MKFIPAQFFECIAEEIKSSHSLIDLPNTLYCKTLSDYDAYIKFKNGIIYEGQIENGIFHGKGKLTLPNGLIIESDFYENKIGNQMKITYSDGSVYEGDIRGMKREGEGTFLKKNMKYEGNWKNNTYHGSGVLEYYNEWKYQGQFVEGKKNGQGTTTYYPD